MRKYWIKYTRNFGNTYNLCWTDGNDLHENEWERITRKEAETKAREERNRRKYDRSFSGFASACICKHGYDVYGDDTTYPVIVDTDKCFKTYEEE